MATPTSLPATFVAGNVLTAAQMNDLRGAFRILQVERATDTTDRSTTSSSYVDTSLNVTITPTSASSDVLVIWSFTPIKFGGSVDERSAFQIIKTGSTALEGAEEVEVGIGGTDNPYMAVTVMGYDSAPGIAAHEYKTRFRTPTVGTVTIRNATNTGQLLALEISA